MFTTHPAPRVGIQNILLSRDLYNLWTKNGGRHLSLIDENLQTVQSFKPWNISKVRIRFTCNLSKFWSIGLNPLKAMIKFYPTSLQIFEGLHLILWRFKIKFSKDCAQSLNLRGISCGISTGSEERPIRTIFGDKI